VSYGLDVSGYKELRMFSRVLGLPADARREVPRTAAEGNRRQVSALGGITSMNEFFTELRDESGQTMAEYAVVLGVITIAVVVTLGLLSTAIQNTLNNVIAAL
jgi:Flp pilus assembly pilin Flp